MHSLCMVKKTVVVFFYFVVFERIEHLSVGIAEFIMTSDIIDIILNYLWSVKCRKLVQRSI